VSNSGANSDTSGGRGHLGKEAVESNDILVGCCRSVVRYPGCCGCMGALMGTDDVVWAGARGVGAGAAAGRAAGAAAGRAAAGAGAAARFFFPTRLAKADGIASGQTNKKNKNRTSLRLVNKTAQ